MLEAVLSAARPRLCAPSCWPHQHCRERDGSLALAVHRARFFRCLLAGRSRHLRWKAATPDRAWGGGGHRTIYNGW